MAEHPLEAGHLLLEAHGVVARTALPPPAARTVYELTPRGRELLAIVGALAVLDGRHGRTLPEGA
ncbi:MAG: winged helix-turn-helix transcriptional regulator [Acidimicrobiia bacterium]